MIHERLAFLNLDEDFLEYLDEEGYVEISTNEIFVEHQHWVKSVTSFWSRMFEPRTYAD